MALTLIFTLGEANYGLEISAIQEIVEDPVLHFVPRAGGVLRGAVNFHGQILAVIDLPGLLGLAGDRHDQRWIVLAPACRSLVLMVNSVLRIVDLDLAETQPPPAEARQEAIRGLVDVDGEEIRLLDTEEILNRLEHIYVEAE